MTLSGHIEVTGLVGTATIRIYVHRDNLCIPLPGLLLDPDQVTDLITELQAVQAFGDAAQASYDEPIPYQPIDPPTDQERP